MYVVVVLFFVFKQKTAYEMRISDWSSDVCSSDLRGNLPLGQAALWKVAHVFGKEGPGACQDCHVEHQGPTRLTAPSQQFCADCHGQLKSNLPDRSEERRVGKECGSTWRFRW